MKHTLLLLTASILVTLNACTNRPSNSEVAVSQDTIKIVAIEIAEPTAIGKRGNGLTFYQDSGFILKKDGLRFLLSAALTDTAGSYWSQVKDNDTIGKYYKVRQTGNFFVCTIDLSQKNNFETFLLLEIKADGTVLKNERFFHGNYLCCLPNYYEGFYKYGDYFCLKTCGTGSGYCGTNMYLFKEIKPQNEQNSIAESYSSFNCSIGLSIILSSTIELHNDYLIMHYELKNGEFNIIHPHFKVKQTDKFDVKYKLQNDTWVATDSTKLKDLDI